ncbi:hypothetical protein F7725_008220 [Dissostichus mawsoni]|uniref:Uncharacterized protein n=1 Tax=Dissostichus mawsoni TaxID=36200 RepID=A0A7J5Y902_DISMA|nr:hypothetical protein F7725_008220 [Dissostichus mawsoni]
MGAVTPLLSVGAAERRRKRRRGKEEQEQEEERMGGWIALTSLFCVSPTVSASIETTLLYFSHMWTADGKMNFTHSLDDERRWETGAVLMLTAAVEDAAVGRHEEQHLNLINPPISSYSLGQCQHLEEWRRVGSVKLLLQREREREGERNLREACRQTLQLMRYDLSDDDTHICLASIRTGTYDFCVCSWGSSVSQWLRGESTDQEKELVYIVQLTGTLWPLLLHNSRASSWSAMRRLGAPSLDQNRK